MQHVPRQKYALASMGANTGTMCKRSSTRAHGHGKVLHRITPACCSASDVAAGLIQPWQRATGDGNHEREGDEAIGGVGGCHSEVIINGYEEDDDEEQLIDRLLRADVATLSREARALRDLGASSPGGDSRRRCIITFSPKARGCIPAILV